MRSRLSLVASFLMRSEVHVESRWYSISKTLICSRVKRRLCFTSGALLQSPSSWESLISDFVFELTLSTCFLKFLECTFLSSSSDYVMAGSASVCACFLFGEGCFKCTILLLVDCRHILLCICIFAGVSMLSLAF